MNWAQELIRCQQLLQTAQNASAGGASEVSLNAAANLISAANKMYAGMLIEITKREETHFAQRAASSTPRSSAS